MIRIVAKEDDPSIEVAETLSFKYHVWPSFESIQNDIKGEWESLKDEVEEKKENGEELSIDDDLFELENYERFAHYQLTKNDKIEILQIIMDKYEEKSYYTNCSLFSDEIIEDSIKEWVTGKFDIEF